MYLPDYDPAFDPVEQFDVLKIPIITHTLHGANALWVPERYEYGMVLLKRGLDPALVRPTLAHEHAHAVNDDCGGHVAKNELRANLHSALRLINPDQWDDLTATHSDYDYICLELGITRRQFRAYANYRRCDEVNSRRVERIGNTIYVDPKHGAGQWADRFEAVA